MTSVARSRALASAYWRARVRQRRLRVAAQRHGVAPATLWRHAQLWPEVIEELQKPNALLPWERQRLNELLGGR